MERERDFFNGPQFDPQKPRPKRPVTDYGSTMVHWMVNRRPRWKGNLHMEMERPSPSYIIDMLPPLARIDKAADTIPVKALHSSLNKQKHPILVVRWTPEGRRLLTGSQSGEFTLWNGMGFNFETIMQAHDASIHAAEWSHSDDWLVSADRDGVVKYWQPNFNNVKVLQAHNEKINDLGFAPTDTKFVTASDDATLKIFDFAGGVEESTLTGHGWEAKTVDWHPTKGLLVSGSKDHQVKLWDPRTGRCLTTFHGHKNTITKTSFHPTQGQLLATCARDNTARIFDLRMMRDVLFLRGHDANIMTLTWHPIHRNLLSTGGYDGALNHYLLDEQNPPPGVAVTLSPYDTPDPANAPTQTIYPAHSIPYAHDYTIWSLNWHPLGHILVSGSNDRVTRFWTRPRPGDKTCFIDRYHIGQAAAEAQGTFDRRDVHRQMQEDENQEEQDEAEGLVDQKMPSKQHMMPSLPGISTAADGTSTGGAQLPGIGGAPPLPPPSGIPAPLPGVDLSKIDFSKIDLSKLPTGIIPGQFPPLPVPPNGAPGAFPPPPPGFPGFPGGIPPPGLLPPGFQMPIGFPPPQPPSGSVPGLPVPPNPPAPPVSQAPSSAASAVDPSIRKRAPLPSQKESLREEMRKGKYRTAR